jgi:hypothetical protein
MFFNPGETQSQQRLPEVPILCIRNEINFPGLLSLQKAGPVSVKLKPKPGF